MYSLASFEKPSSLSLNINNPSDLSGGNILNKKQTKQIKN